MKLQVVKFKCMPVLWRKALMSLSCLALLDHESVALIFNAWEASIISSSQQFGI